MRLTINNYQKLAMYTANKEMLKNPDESIINGILGLLGESGEIADYIKKVKYQGHKFDKEIIIKELGDVCWYIALIATSLNYDLETIMQLNINKLKARYPNGFEVEKSIKREELNEDN